MPWRDVVLEAIVTDGLVVAAPGAAIAGPAESAITPRPSARTAVAQLSPARYLILVLIVLPFSCHGDRLTTEVRGYPGRATGS